MSTIVDDRRFLEAAGCDDSLLYSVTSSSNGGLFSPVGFPLGALVEQDEELKEQKEEEEQKEEQKEEKEEEVDGEGSVRAFDQETRLGQNAACEEHRAAVRQQASIIDRLLAMVKGINGERKCLIQERKGLIQEICLLKLENDILVRKLASLVPCSESASEAVTARAQQAPAPEDVQGSPSTSVARAQALLQKIRRDRSEEVPPDEQEAPMSSPPIATEPSLASPAFASSAAVDDEETSPAEMASAFLGREQCTTPATSSITPPMNTPVVAVDDSAGCIVTFTEDARERAPRAKGPVARGSVGGTMRPGSRSNTRIRQPTAAPSGGVGFAARSVRRPSARSQAAAAPLGNGASSTRPVSRPAARQSKGRRNATAYQQPLSCTRETVASRLRSRQAVKPSGPRGMVF